MKKYTLIIMIIALTATYTTAQFPIRIPKIKIPKIEQPKQEQPTQPSQTSQPSQAQRPNSQQNQPKSSGNISDNPSIGIAQNRQMVMNDSYTFFIAEDFKRYEQNKISNFDGGWYLDSRLQILGTFPESSAFRIKIKKNGKELSNVRCEGDIYSKADDSRFKTPAARAGKVDSNFEDSMKVDSRCYDTKRAIKETGKMDVEVYFVDGNTDDETLVRKYVIDVQESTRVKGRQENPVADYSDYYIQRHAESGVAFAYLKPLNSSGKQNAQLIFETSFSSSDNTTEFVNIVKETFARCSVNGNKIPLSWDKVRVSTSGTEESAIYIDRKAPKYRKQATPYREVIKFKRLYFVVPIYSGDEPFPDRPKLEEHRGKWECSMISNGVTFRTFRWEVGSDGRIVPHDEQKSGNINLYYNQFLVDMEIPAGGSPFDKRLAPMPEMGLFYGIPWTTAEGKAMAAKVPRKGSPGPVPSDKQK